VVALVPYAQVAGVVPVTSVKVHPPATSGSSAAVAVALSDTLRAAIAVPCNVTVFVATSAEAMVRWPACYPEQHREEASA